MYLLDSDTLIYSLKGDAAVQKQLVLHMNDALKVSVISLMELYYGAFKSERVAGNLAKVRKIEQHLESVPVGIEVAEIFGMLKSDMESKGTRLDDFDLIIASSALAHNLILVTNNIRHFERIEGLKIENWTNV